MADHSGIWRLDILFENGHTSSVFGTNEVIEIAVEEWIKWKTACEPSDKKIIKVIGHSDSSDKGPCFMTLDLSSVISMTAQQMYG